MKRRYCFVSDVPGRVDDTSAKTLIMLSDLRVSRKTVISDLTSGIVMAVVNVPGALAHGVLAGVNPVYGLYSMIAGTTVAALFTSSVIMNVDSTSATALATADALSGTSPERHLQYLVMMVVLVGLFQLVFGLLKLGFLTRFISNSVMTGFVTGIAALTILGQVGDLTAYSSQFNNRVAHLIDTLLHFWQIDLPTLIVGLLTIGLILGLGRTRFSRYAYALALGLTTALVPLLGWDTVALVGDTTNIPQSLPSLHLPGLSLVPGMMIPALAIAIIALVQSAGVSQSVPNPDGKYPDINGDFRGQGAANIATGLCGGLPVGGSLSGTAMMRNCGGQSRWANIFAGLIAAIMVLLFARLIELLPMPALAGLLVTAGIDIVNVPRIETAWNTGSVPRAMMLITFVATLALPIQNAVLFGVVLHILLHVFQSAEKVRIEQIIPLGDGQYAEGEQPKQIADGEIMLLQPIGSLFFAGAAEFEEDLPEVGDVHGAVVIIRLRDRDEVGSTFIRVIERYARKLQSNGCRLMLAGINDRVWEQLEKTGLLDMVGPENVFLAQPRFGAAIEEALAAAQAWLDESKGDQ
jgi:SulP family sulfate permease